MYNVNIEKLFKLLDKDLDNFNKIRSIMDAMFLILKTHRATSSQLKKIKISIDDKDIELIKASNISHYLSVVESIENADVTFTSKVLKQHYEDQQLLDFLNKQDKIDQSSLKSKNKIDKKDNIFNINECILIADTYKGLLPTSDYQQKGEVFKLPNDKFIYLKEKYPFVDVEGRLQELYSHLKENPLQRKHFSKMDNFIESWVSGILIKISKRKNKKTKESYSGFYERFLANE